MATTIPARTTSAPATSCADSASPARRPKSAAHTGSDAREQDRGPRRGRVGLPVVLQPQEQRGGDQCEEEQAGRQPGRGVEADRLQQRRGGGADQAGRQDLCEKQRARRVAGQRGVQPDQLPREQQCRGQRREVGPRRRTTETDAAHHPRADEREQRARGGRGGGPAPGREPVEERREDHVEGRQERRAGRADLRHRPGLQREAGREQHAQRDAPARRAPHRARPRDDQDPPQRRGGEQEARGVEGDGRSRAHRGVDEREGRPPADGANDERRVALPRRAGRRHRGF